MIYDFFKNSLIYRLFMWIIHVYENSIIHKFLTHIGDYYAGSVIKRAADAMINKEYHEETSYFCKLQRTVVSWLNRLGDKIHGFCVPILQKSGIYHFIANIKKPNKREPSSGMVSYAVSVLMHYKYFIIALAVIAGALAVMSNIVYAAIGIVLICEFIMVMSDYNTALYVLALFAVIEYFFRTYVAPFAPLWDKLALLALFMLWVYKWLVYRKRDAFKCTPLDLPILLYIAANFFILLINSNYFMVAFDGMRVNIQFILFYFVTLNLLNNRKNAVTFINVLLAAGVLISLHGIYQYITKTPMPVNWVDSLETGIQTRAFSIVGSPNILGSLMSALSCIAIGMMFSTKKLLRKLTYLGAAGLMALCLVVTFSRGAWIGFAVAVVVIILFKNKKIIIPAIFAGLILIVFLPSVSDRILYMLSPSYIESSLSGGRLIRWLTGLQIWNEHKFTGVGLGHFGGAVAMNYRMTLVIDKVNTSTFYMDNYYLKQAVEGGILLITGYLYLLYQIMSWICTAIKKSRDLISKDILIGLFAGFASLLVHNVTENVFEVPMMQIYFYILLGVCMHLWHLNQSVVKQSDDHEKTWHDNRLKTLERLIHDK